MTDFAAFLANLEADVATARRASESSCQAYAALAEPARAALRSVMRFLGCPADEPAPGDAEPVDQPNRVRIARIMLLRFHADTFDPRWSSKALEDLSDAVHSLPGATMGDLLEALADLWESSAVPLTDVIGNFAKDVGMLCFTRHRRSYAAADFSWLVERLNGKPGPAVAYLTLRTLPPEHTPGVKQIILDTLSGTKYAAEAASLLDDD